MGKLFIAFPVPSLEEDEPPKEEKIVTLIFELPRSWAIDISSFI
jgi:hypothetical protein